MTSRRSFLRKITYLVAIGVLLLPLFWLGRPATSSTSTGESSPGGILAQLRAEHRLSQADLGEIDPTSETIKLATLGLRGVAANVLWQKANGYKMKKDWTNLSATLEQLTKLEPHFIAVWRFQAWNLSYNVSAEFDDFRERYRWVIKGIEFLEKGVRLNEQSPRLLWDMGWFIAQKIGRADEHRQFRLLFKADDDFHGARPVERRDNWLVGKEWFARAERLVDQGASLGGMSPVIFYSDRAMSDMNYSEALEEDGIFGERARRSWDLAYRGWTEGPVPGDQVPFGMRDITTSFGDVIRLNDREKYEKTLEEMKARFEAITPGVRERIEQQRRARLTPAEREALDAEERTEQQHQLAAEAAIKLNVTYEDVANEMSGAEKSRALEMAKRLSETERITDLIRRYREIVNFEHWRRRAEFEQSDEALEARELIHEGNRAFAQAKLEEARENYDRGLQKWREVLDKFDGLIRDTGLGRDLMDVIIMYRRILDARDEPFPTDFVLQDVIDRHGHSAEGWMPYTDDAEEDQE